jgi:hypothetical protein
VEIAWGCSQNLDEILPATFRKLWSLPWILLKRRLRNRWIPIGKRFSFDDLLQRIHPAASRINRLAAERPAVFLAFDPLRCGTDDMARLPLRKRRPAPERFAIAFHRQVGIMPMPNGGSLQPAAAVTASSRNASIFPTRVAIATACRRSSGYALRTVIGGFRCGEKRTAGRKVVGSLLLGLYDQNGLLSHVGFTSGLKSGRGERRRDGFPMIRKPFSARDLADIMHEGAFADVGASKNSAASQDYPNDLLNYNL